jgi:hypothetical protein
LRTSRQELLTTNILKGTKEVFRRRNGMRNLHFVRQFVPVTLAAIPVAKEGSPLVKLLACKGSQTIMIFFGNWTAKRRQIGNAVPPSMGALILLEIIKSLMETDAKRANGYENTSSAYSESY